MPLAANAAEQQACFDEFRRHYNEERPYEALSQLRPGKAYAPSLPALTSLVDDP